MQAVEAGDVPLSGPAGILNNLAAHIPTRNLGIYAPPTRRWSIFTWTQWRRGWRPAPRTGRGREKAAEERKMRVPLRRPLIFRPKDWRFISEILRQWLL